MEAPPPYMPPKKKSNTGLIIGIVVGAVLICCIGPLVLFGGGLFWVFNKSKGLVQCTYAFRDVRDGLRQYAADHGGKLPDANGWQDEVAPYYSKIISQSNAKDRKIIGIMPASGAWGCDNGSGGTTGMALNDEVAGQELTKMETSSAVVLFEVEQATKNAHEKYQARSEASSPKLLGTPRGWFLIRMSGEPMLSAHGHEQPVNTGPGSD